MVEHVAPATNAVVTLDVAIPGIFWGWMITLNMWAKSIGTGVVFVGAYLLYRHNKEALPNLKLYMPIVSFIFLNIFLLFTLLDLHQPFRMLNIFLHPHFTSAITVGAWFASAFTGLIAIMSLTALGEAMGKECKLQAKYDKMLWTAVVLAIPVTLYTATIMGEATARELWQTPTELIQMFLAALLAGSAILLILSKGWDDSIKRELASILGLSAIIMFTMFMGEYYFGHMKAEEVAATIAFVKPGGEYHIYFWVAMTFAFIVPAILVFISLKNRTNTFLYLASIIALVGLYMAKDVWLKIPQLLPLS